MECLLKEDLAGKENLFSTSISKKVFPGSHLLILSISSDLGELLPYYRFGVFHPFEVMNP